MGIIPYTVYIIVMMIVESKGRKDNIRQYFIEYIVIAIVEFIAIICLPIGVSLHVEVQQLKEEHRIEFYNEEQEEEPEKENKESFKYNIHFLYCIY